MALAGPQACPPQHSSSPRRGRDSKPIPSEQPPPRPCWGPLPLRTPGQEGLPPGSPPEPHLSVLVSVTQRPPPPAAPVRPLDAAQGALRGSACTVFCPQLSALSAAWLCEEPGLPRRLPP